MMNTGIQGQVINHKYWQTLKSVETKQKETRPSNEAIEFEKHLQTLERENRLYEMGVAMKKASLQTNKDLVCSLEALKCNEMKGKTRAQNPHDSHWYLTKDRLVDDEEDVQNDELLAIVEKSPEYCPIVKKVIKEKPETDPLKLSV